MQDRYVFEELTGWMQACQENEVRAAVIRQVREVRPVPGVGQAVTVERARWADVIGYRAGVVYRVRLASPPPTLKRDLEAAGFTVREVSDNVT